jgi:hypothetical protein
VSSNNLFALLHELDQKEPRELLWKSIGMLPALSGPDGRIFVGQRQFERVCALTSSHMSWDMGPQIPDELFAPEIVTSIGNKTCITKAPPRVRASEESLWMQLLPFWVEETENKNLKSDSRWHEADINDFRAYFLDASLADCINRSRQRHHEISSSRVGLFTRSANYMGSKASLAAHILDVIEAVETNDVTMFDLMCGSGVMTGAFSRHHPTIASDSQYFCRLLGLVQSGGMTRAKGISLAEEVVSGARRRYQLLSHIQLKRIDEESRLINSELSPESHDLVISELRRRLIHWEENSLGGLDAVTSSWQQGCLLSHLYGGLYFGERQSAELDCLRQTIEHLPDPFDRQWALGALVCAASACAYTYGGHFAQPKLDVTADGKQRGDLSEALKQRALSVTHEFYARLTRLSEESERVQHAAEVVVGPWEAAVQEVAHREGKSNICVYLDPPYTRDEYSRYYHVLEAIVRYEPQSVSGKGRLPKRGSVGRFASSLSGRQPKQIELEIAKVLRACLDNGWNCLWSYSDSGTASIVATLAHIEGIAKCVEIFEMKHVYKAQGKHRPKPVHEYAIHMRPAS